MKKFLFTTLIGILFTGCSITNEKETRTLESFNAISVVGNAELHLQQNTSHSIQVMTRNKTDLNDLITEVRDGKLYIYTEQDCDHCESPKYELYLNHSGISDLNLTGIITLNSDDVLSEKELVINGDGILRGNVEVASTTLKVDLKGISHMSFSGDTDTSILKIAGIGLMNASGLKTKNAKNISQGIAMITK
jgi:hypothetical protein